MSRPRSLPTSGLARRLTALAAPALAAALAAGCGDDAGGDPDGAAPDAPAGDAGPDANPDMPASLAETGLCADPSCATIADDVHAYAPAYALWSDGSTKRRWIRLPPGTTIDTSDLDHWRFPVGTKLWKEFTRDGVRVETRLLLKVGEADDAWFRAAYAWNQAQDDAPLADPVYGAQDVLGTDHDIPSRSDCRKCHDQQPGGVLGFQAILLDHDGAGLTLEALDALGWLSTALPAPDAGGRYFRIPGDDAARAALGYLHVNCGNCHNPASTVQDTVRVDWRLRVGLLGAVEDTPAWTTAVGVLPSVGGVGGTAIIEPGMPAASAVYLRMVSTTPSNQMPPIAREVVDGDGAAIVAAWIESIPAP